MFLIFLGRLLYNKFKLDLDHIPKEIKKSEGNIKKAYLRAVFDDEGSVSKKGQIRLKMKYKSYVDDVRNLLLSLGIQCSNLIFERSTKINGAGNCYYFLISGQSNFRLFQEKVGFNHPKKSAVLKKALSKIKFKTYGNLAKKKILDILKNEGSKTAEQLAKRLDRTSKTISYHLRNLSKEEGVNFKKVRKKYTYKYIWFIENEAPFNYCRKAFSSKKNS